jgi:hypothetical protein
MVFEKEGLVKCLKDVGNKLEKPVAVYLIGGGCMSLRELKTATKDIDIVLTSRGELEIFNNALLVLGYQPAVDLGEEFYLTATVVYAKGDSRIDLFFQEVAGKLEFTKSMQERAEFFGLFGKLTIHLTSPEDMFLFKSVTGRKDDLDDCRMLFLRGLDWNVIFEECVEQSKKKAKWFFWFYERICELEEDYDLISPIKSRLLKVCKEHWDECPKDFLTCVRDKARFL